MNKHNHANVFVPRPGEPEPAEVRIRAGDPLSSQVKVVCAKCNSGWLNRVQQAARPFLLPLFEGAKHTVDPDTQSRLAAWIAMATMTGEYLSQTTETHHGAAVRKRLADGSLHSAPALGDLDRPLSLATRSTAVGAPIDACARQQFPPRSPDRRTTSTEHPDHGLLRGRAVCVRHEQRV